MQQRHRICKLLFVFIYILTSKCLFGSLLVICIYAVTNESVELTGGDLSKFRPGASTPLKHGRSLCFAKKPEGIRHILHKSGEDRLTGSPLY